MKNFFTAFYQSLYNIDWLKEMRIFPGRAWKYFALFILLFAFLTAIPAAFGLHAFFTDLNQELSSNFPDFEASVKNGKLSVSKLNQPFIYNTSDGQFAIVIDTIATNTVAVQDFVTSSDKTVLLLTADQAELRDASGGDRTQNWSNLNFNSYTKNDLKNFVGKIVNPLYQFLIFIAIVAALYIGAFVLKLYSVIVVSLLVSAFCRMLGRPYKLNEVFVMCLYATTLSTLVSVGFTLTGIQISYINFITLFSFMLALVFTDDGEKKENEEE